MRTNKKLDFDIFSKKIRRGAPYPYVCAYAGYVKRGNFFSRECNIVGSRSLVNLETGDEELIFDVMFADGAVEEFHESWILVKQES